MLSLPPLRSYDCDDNDFCGGTWRGTTKMLDYVQVGQLWCHSAAEQHIVRSWERRTLGRGASLEPQVVWLSSMTGSPDG